MKENSIEEIIKQLELILKVRKEQKEIIECAGGSCMNCDPDIKALTESIKIVSDYKRVLKENEMHKRNSEIMSKENLSTAEQLKVEIKENFRLKNQLENNRKEYQETYKDVREELKELKKENEELKNKLKEKDKIIDLMAERAVLTEEEWKEIKEKNIYNVIQKDTHKLIKQYFENKAKEVKNGKYIG